MPAPSLGVLLNFEAQINAAARNILRLAGYPHIWQKGDTGQRPAAFTAVDVEIGDATGRLGMRPEGTQEYTHFTAVLFVAVGVELRDNEPFDDTTGTALDRECGIIRSLFLNHPNPFPRYTEHIQVHAIKPLAAVYDTRGEEGVELRTLKFELHFIIPDAAWPAVS